MAKKLFGDEDPIGKIVKIDNSENFTVTALLKDLPDNTQFEIEYLNSSEYLRAKGYFDTDWTNISIRTFALLKPGTSLSNINSKIKDIDVRYSGNRAKTIVLSLSRSVMSGYIPILKTANRLVVA